MSLCVRQRYAEPRTSKVCQGMNYDAIRRSLPGYRFTDHARREMDTEPLGRIGVEEILAVLDSARSSRSIERISHIRVA